MAEKRSKEAEIKFLIGQTIQDLWRTDLDAVLAQWEQFKQSQAELESTRPGKSGPSKKIPLKKVKKTNDSDVSMDGEDDEFAVTKKKKSVKAKSSNSLIPKKEVDAPISVKPSAGKPPGKPAVKPSDSASLKPKSKATAQKGIESYFSSKTSNVRASSPVASLSESLSSMEVDSKKKTQETESMQVSEDDLIKKPVMRRSPRGVKKKTIVISSDSDISESEAESEEDFEESDFQDEE